MTLLDNNRFVKSNENLWDENTLKPPLKPKELVKDLLYHWRSYKNNKISHFRRYIFFILMIYQRISYNLGWLLSIFKHSKKF